MRKKVSIFIAMLGFLWFRESLAKVETRFNSNLFSSSSNQNSVDSQNSTNTIDTRFRPDWTKPPYNKIVRITEQTSSTDNNDAETNPSCAGFFISSDVVITSDLCAFRFDSVTVYVSNGNHFSATKIYSAYNDENNRVGRYIFFKVEGYSSPNWFEINPKIKNSYESVMVTGFGNMRILNDSDLEQVRKIMIDLLEKETENINRILKDRDKNLKQRPSKININDSQDLMEAIDIKLSELGRPAAFKDGNTLKANKCNVLNDKSNEWNLYTNCITANGDYGGPMIDNTDGSLIGMLLEGFLEVDNMKFTSYAVRLARFYDKIKEKLDPNYACKKFNKEINSYNDRVEKLLDVFREGNCTWDITEYQKGNIWIDLKFEDGRSVVFPKEINCTGNGSVEYLTRFLTHGEDFLDWVEKNVICADRKLYLLETTD